MTPQTETGKRLLEAEDVGGGEVYETTKWWTDTVLAIEAEAIVMLAPLVAVTHEEDGSWSAEIAAMPGHIGADDTIVKAAVQAHDAALSWLEAYREQAIALGAKSERERLREACAPVIRSIENLSDRQAIFNLAGRLTALLAEETP